MAIEIKENFEVRAPIDEVWRFVMDPQQVAACMPGAALDEVGDDQSFQGTIKIQVGAVTASYKAHVRFSEVDEQHYAVQITGEGRETGGGTARGTMSSRLRALDGGGTEVVAEASIDLTGRIVQVGRGMIQGVSHELFQQFVACATARLEAEPGSAEAETASDEPIRILPVMLRATWAAIAGFFRRLFGRDGPRA